MSFENIYTPRGSIDMLYALPNQKNKQVCTKIPYRGYEISICMDSSHGDGDLHRSDIRVYHGPHAENDVTKELMPDYTGDVWACAESLIEVFAAIDKVTAIAPQASNT